MMTNYFLIFSFLLSFVSYGIAGHKNYTVINQSNSLCSCKDTIKNGTKIFPTSEYFLKNGKSFKVHLEYESDYLVNARITGNGFPNSNDTILFDEIELIDTIIVADINNDGYEELYIFTRGFSPGAYDHVFGVTSDEDKAYKEINFYDVQPEDLKEDGILDGWLGQDIYTLENNLIKRTFPVYSPGDFYNNPSRGFRTLYYTLEKTDSGYYYKLKN